MEVPDYTMTSNFQSGLEVTKYMARKGLKISHHIKNLTIRSKGKRNQCWGRFCGDNFAGRYMPQGGCALFLFFFFFENV